MATQRTPSSSSPYRDSPVRCITSCATAAHSPSLSVLSSGAVRIEQCHTGRAYPHFPSAASTWCATVTNQGHAIGHGCARPAPVSPIKRRRPGPSDRPGPPGEPRFTFTPADQPGPPGGYGRWRFSIGIPGQRDLLLEIGPIPTDGCDHRHEAKGRDPGVMLRHLTQVRHATCTGPGCRRPAAGCDFDHNVPYEAGSRTCMCNGNPKCRRDHRVK